MRLGTRVRHLDETCHEFWRPSGHPMSSRYRPSRWPSSAAGPHATADPAERAARQDLLQRAEATFDPLPVDSAVARAYGRVYAAVATAGRKSRGRRAFDLLIAATALAAGLPLVTRNADDFAELADMLEVVPL